MKNGRIEQKNGIVKHYLDGKLHRIDGPAVEEDNGSFAWYKHGKLHREDGGPALFDWYDDEYAGQSWWINGYHLTEVNSRRHFFGAQKGYFSNDSGKYYYKNYKLHRENGPAHITGDFEAWYFNGKRHRDVLPAFVSETHKEWYQNDKLHRENGPASITQSGESWYHRGILHRIDGPAIINKDGSEHWYNKGVRHRIGGPASSTAGGDEIWMVDGKLHRLDGPAHVFSPNTQWAHIEFWVDDKPVAAASLKDFLKKVSMKAFW